MNRISRKLFVGFVWMALAFLLVSCNAPTTEEEDPSARQTAVAQTVDASLLTSQPQQATTEVPQATDTPAGTALPSDTPATTAVTPTNENEDVVGDDRAEFVADVTIPDYSEHLLGDEITKTWRVRNVGDTTWTTDYYLEFDKGQILGAPEKINLTNEVGPNNFVDLSVDFIVPDEAGEYTSYWQLRNGDDELVGIDDEGTPLSIYMVINAVEEGGAVATSTGTSGGIAGGAKVTGATVSVDDANYSGSCPAQVTFTYTVTTSNAGKVNFYLDLTPISPPGYSFDATPDYSESFTGGYTVTYTYTLFSNSSVTATAKVIAVGEKTYTSSPINFKINCN